MEELVVVGRREPRSGSTGSRSGSTSTRFPLVDDGARGAPPAPRSGLPDDAFVVGSFQKDGVGWGDGLEPKLVKGPDVLVEALARAHERASGARRAAHRSGARVRPDASSSGAASRTSTVLLADRDGLAQAPTTRSTPTSSPRVRRAARRACSSPWRPASRSSAPGSGRRPTWCEDGENGSARRRRRRRRARRRACVRVTRRPRARRAAPRSAGRATAEATLVRGARTRAGRRFWTGSSSAAVAQWMGERAGRYARAASRWARLLTRRPCTPGLRVFYGWDRVPAPGEPVAGGTAKLQKLAARFPNRPTDFTLLYLGTTCLPRDLRPLLWVARRRGAQVVRQPGRRRLPGLGGRAHGRAATVPLRRALRGADHVLYQSAFCKRSSDAFLGEPSGRVGDPPERRRRGALHARRAAPPAGGPVLLLGGDQTQAYRLELALETFRHVLDAASRTRGSSSAGGSSPIPAPLIARLGLGAAVELTGRVRAARGARRLPPRARPAPHEGQRPLPDRRDRGDGVRAAGRRTRRAAARSSSSATWRASASRTPTGSSGTSRRRRRRSPPPSPRARRPRPLSREAPAARAVERFALTDWLDRHAELFASLVA